MANAKVSVKMDAKYEGAMRSIQGLSISMLELSIRSLMREHREAIRSLMDHNLDKSDRNISGDDVLDYIDLLDNQFAGVIETLQDLRERINKRGGEMTKTKYGMAYPNLEALIEAKVETAKEIILEIVDNVLERGLRQGDVTDIRGLERIKQHLSEALENQERVEERHA